MESGERVPNEPQHKTGMRNGFLPIILGGLVMKKNIGNIERIIRVAIGLIILSLTFVGPQSLWGLIGILPIATGLAGWCPPYAMLGISTCKIKKVDKQPNELAV